MPNNSNISRIHAITDSMKINEQTIFRIAQIGWGISWFFAFLFLFNAFFVIWPNISLYWSAPVVILMMVSFEVMETHSEWLQE